MSNTTHHQARDFAERLRRDAEEYHQRRIDHEEAAARHARTWDEIEAAGCRDEVVGMLREVPRG
jgi:uncharacterized protein YdaU (DUF1376 family)